MRSIIPTVPLRRRAQQRPFLLEEWDTAIAHNNVQAEPRGHTLDADNHVLVTECGREGAWARACAQWGAAKLV